MSENSLLNQELLQNSDHHAVSDQNYSVEVFGASKHFGNVVALSDISLSIKDGEIVSLLGPSGCGKTTLMRLIAGFEAPTNGSIKIDGLDVAGIPPEDRPVNMVFQRYALFPHLDVFSNVAFGLKMKGVRKDEIRDRVVEILRIVQLTDFADRQIGQLSGGQCQRVALARALVNKPKVLLLDEPLAALDLKIRQHMLVEMKRIHAETKATFIYVTHDQDEAMILSDRIVLMEKGRVMQVDPPHKMYARPKSLFAAKFLGETNFLHGVVKERTESKTVLDLPDNKQITSCVSNDVNVGQKAVVSLRPEAIKFHNNDETFNQSMNGVVKDITFIGSRSFYDVELEIGETVSVQVQDVVGGNLPNINENVSLFWDANHVVVLPG